MDWLDAAKRGKNNIPQTQTKFITLDLVVNRTYGGFCLSRTAMLDLSEMKKMNLTCFDIEEMKRDDIDLINVIKKHRDEASGDIHGIHMKIKVVTLTMNPETENCFIRPHGGYDTIYVSSRNKKLYIIDDYGNRKISHCDIINNEIIMV